MIKRAIILALIVCLMLVLSLGPAQAQGELRVLGSSAEAEFPLKLNFSLAAESDARITDIRLNYTVEQTGFAEVTSEVYVVFEPATRVEVGWTWDMRRTGGLPPGSTVEYWWTIEDAGGRRVETAPLRVEMDDNRYSWQSLTRGKVTLYWYSGGESFAGELMETVEEAMVRLAEDTGAYLVKPVRIYIYENTNDLKGAMVFPQEWTGGVAFTRHSVIAIGINPLNLSWGKRAIAHELTHLVIHQMVLNPYNELPTWLDEGLAVYSEGPFDVQFESYLKKAVAEDRLISVQSLASPFSAYAEQSYLSYAESYSMVEFLISRYGRDMMLELLNTFREGSSYDGALEKVYGFDMDGLNDLWRDYVNERYEEAGVWNITDWLEKLLIRIDLV
jgi:hypothetical protein